MKTSDGRRPKICRERKVALQISQSIKLVVINYFATMQEEIEALKKKTAVKKKEAMKKVLVIFFV